MEPVFAGKHALLVGGTGGIGRALALGLAERGAAVTVTGGSSPERLEAVLGELELAAETSAAGRRPPSQTGGFLCTIGGPGGYSPEGAVEFILNRAGFTPGEAPDILAAAWGPFKRFTLEETMPADWRFLTESNLIFPGILISSVLCGMIKKGWGRILLFGGTGTEEIRGFSTTAAYSAAKTALGVLAKSAAKAGEKAGVTCNIICPGFTNTEYTGTKERAYNRKKSPGGRVMGPEDVARLALEALENPVLNGAVLSPHGFSEDWIGLTNRQRCGSI
ncbi:MAG: SDR family oxidoreductase [Treponema sp.]|jgi:NAD(P)-dependent dehydrogenase (short-subunit alcohol dehydrogenase family)|nr:SDR family oxidoreductase [Treponema sp.]